MSEPPRRYELVAKRVAKMKDSYDCSPVELLQHVIYCIESGEDKARSVLVITLEESEGGGWDTTSYRAKLTAREEVTLLTCAEYRALHKLLTP